MQLRFASFVAINLRRDLHPQECAHAERTRKKKPARSGLFPGRSSRLEDQFAADAAAVNWFRTYLKERPNGALAREASGRLLEALSRSGDRSGAERAAESYLARYPSGQHAAFARQLLGR